MDTHILISQKKKRKKEYPFRTTHFKENLIRFDLKHFNTMKNSEQLYKGHYAMMNNRQLTSSIDSLELKYKEKKILFKQNISSKYTNEAISNTLYEGNKKTEKEKKKYDLAINKVRTLQSITKSNKDDLKYRQTIITKHKIEWHRKISLAVACLLLFLIGAPLGAIIRKGGFGIPVLVSVIFFILYHVINMIGEKSAKDLSMQAHEGMWLSNILFIPIAIFLIYKAKNDLSLFEFSRLTLIFNRFRNSIQ